MVEPLHAPVAQPRMSEAELQRAVIECARALGWRVAHFRPAQTRAGRWVTPVSADGAGFPDLVLARNGVVLFVELKTEKGRMSDEQAKWRLALPAMFLWRPADWVSGHVERVLRG